MAIYKAKQNQNLYDVAIHTHGTVEGIFDILISNPGLNMNSVLSYGQEVVYHEDYILFPTIVKGLNDKGIVPVSGSRHIYNKSFSAYPLCFVDIDEFTKDIAFDISGSGTLLVDWGDNSKVEQIVLSAKSTTIYHNFDTDNQPHRVKIYKDPNTISINLLNLSKVNGMLVVCEPFPVKEVIYNQGIYQIAGFALFTGVTRIDLTDSWTPTLAPIITHQLAYLNLTDIKAGEEALKEYFAFMKKLHNERGGCEFILPADTSDEVKETISAIIAERAELRLAAWTFNYQ